MARPQHRENNGAPEDVELPEGWAWTKLGQICGHPQYGWTTSAHKSSNGLKLLRTSDISSNAVDWTSVPVCATPPDDPTKYELTRGDIVVSRAGSVGVSYLIRDCPCSIFASYLIRLRPLPPIPSDFVYLFLQSPAYWAAISEHTAGIAIPNINASKLKELLIPLPPVAEQKRIVAKIDALLAHVNAARERLAKVPAVLKRFRQSVLAAACSGRLTADWRDSHLEIEPASVLLERARARRLKGTNDGRTEDDEDNELLGELPENWAVSRIGDAFDVYVGATPSRKKPEYWNGNIPWVSSGEVAFCRIRNTREMITDAGLSNSSGRLHPPGTVLLAMIGEGKTRGQAAILDITAAHNQNSASVRVSQAGFVPEFVYHFFEFQYLHTRRRGEGSNQPALNKERVKAIIFPVPPLEEQREIVRRVEALFRLADAIEKRVAMATTRADKLTQSILIKAFRGELVPTEADLARREGRDYEPASALLDRIRASRDGDRPAARRDRRSRGAPPKRAARA